MKMENQKNASDYLKYFKPRKPNQSHFLKQNRKLLPHITEEYHFRITNHLLINKIISPKRDKLIIQSLDNVRRIFQSSSLHKRSNLYTRTRQRSSNVNYKYGRIRKNNSEKHIVHLPANQQKDPLSNISNSLFVRPNQTSKKEVNSIKNKISIKTNPILDSINEGPSKIFLSPLQSLNNYKETLGYNSRPSGDFSLSQYQSRWFGNGPTILLITQIEIASIPQIKNQCLIQLQLLQNPFMAKSIWNNHDSKQVKVIRSTPISYQDLPHLSNPLSAVKFAIKVSKIGDFLPLRLWKYSGVESIELGTIDLPLNLYKQKRTGNNQDGLNCMKWQFKKGRTDIGRAVFTGEISSQLQKGKIMEVETKASIKYKLYSKRLTKYDPHFQLQED